MIHVPYRWPIGPGYLGLGQLIAALEQENPERVLPFGFHNPHSYRGDYYELAFEPAHNISIGDMLAAAKSALGATFEGWKGGEFTMGEHSDCWIAVRGESTDDKIGPMLLAAILSQPEVPQPEPAPKCEAPQTTDCPYAPTHIAEYWTGKVAMTGGEPSPLLRRIPVCGACVNDVPGLHRVQLNGGAR